MITLAIKNKQDQVIVGRIDHEKRTRAISSFW